MKSIFKLSIVAAAVCAVTGVSSQSTANTPNAIGPQNAAAGQCYAKVVLPARFETRSEQVVKVPATQRTEIIPATYKTVSEQVLVSPEHLNIFTSGYEQKSGSVIICVE